MLILCLDFLIDLIGTLCTIMSRALYSQNARPILILEQLVPAYLRLFQVFHLTRLTKPFKPIFLLFTILLIISQFSVRSDVCVEVVLLFVWVDDINKFFKLGMLIGHLFILTFQKAS